MEISLLENKTEIEKRIRSLVIKKLLDTSSRARGSIQSKIRNLIRTTIQNTDTYKSVLNEAFAGGLRSELGIPDGLRKFAEIIDKWTDNLEVTVNRSAGEGILLRIRGIESSYSDVLVLSSAHQETEKGEQLEWLRWLLLEGSQGIIRDYRIGPGRGRAGPIIMIKRENRIWKVPSRFQGVSGNNFITKAIDSIEQEIQNIIIKEFMRNIK